MIHDSNTPRHHVSTLWVLLLWYLKYNLLLLAAGPYLNMIRTQPSLSSRPKHKKPWWHQWSNFSPFRARRHKNTFTGSLVLMSSKMIFMCTFCVCVKDTERSKKSQLIDRKPKEKDNMFEREHIFSLGTHVTDLASSKCREELPLDLS